MKHQFYKYHGTGNDFIIIDNRHNVFDKNNTNLVAQWCDRRFGIGADGLILLEDHPTYDFKMVYYNSDGNISTMCGNGGRCITHFAQFLGIIADSAIFEAIDGKHYAKISDAGIELQMNAVHHITSHANHLVLNTGSPHFVTLVEGVDDVNVASEGSAIRYSDPFAKEGININFVEKVNGSRFKVRTYERGVEGETLSCGTGVTAAAIAMDYIGETEKNVVAIITKGGDLKVTFEKKGSGYDNIWLIGPAVQVFKGEISW